MSRPFVLICYLISNLFWTLSAFSFPPKTIKLSSTMSLSSSSASSSSSEPTSSSTSLPLQTQIAFVTGGNKGIGKEIVRRLYNDTPHTITILACRNLSLGNATRDELIHDSSSRSNHPKQTHKNEIIVCPVPVDLMDEISLQKATTFVKTQYGRLDILINNAAVCFNDPTLYGKVPHTPFQQQAAITINTNFFGTLKLTELMLPIMIHEENHHQQQQQVEQPTPSKPNQSNPSTNHNTNAITTTPRIINIASAAGRLSILKSKTHIDQVTSPNLSINELKQILNQFIQAAENGTHLEQGFPNTCYGMSKLAIIAMTQIFSKLYPHHKLMINAVDPGFCATDQNNHQGYITAERGSLTPFLLATLPMEQINRSGSLFYEEKEIVW